MLVVLTFYVDYYRGLPKAKYSFCQIKPHRSHFMKQNADYQLGISQAKSTAASLLTPKFLTTNDSFQMSYYVRIFLKGHENCQEVKAKSSKKLTFY